MTPQKPPRVRIAPSPTGPLHMGTARTALFNWLFARKRGGVFIVRIEDTDSERSTPEFEMDILEGLKWLGIEWDEGLIIETIDKRQETREKGNFGHYRQSDRGEIYERYTRKLLTAGHAYWCFCSKEELETMRQSMLSQGLAPRYNSRCRSISPQEAEKRHNGGESAVLRFKMPEAKITVSDIIRGKAIFDLSLHGDIVIARGLRDPLYNFAAVIDDAEMEISHVIRAEDHFSNTPKQIAIQQALGLPTPHYAHLPLILNPDRSKMSKRFSDTAVSEFRRTGYLPEALLNFLALLGWHPSGESAADGEGGEREIFSRDELIPLFELERVQKASAIFNEQKLDWMNGQYIRTLAQEDLLGRIRDTTIIPDGLSQASLLRLISFTRERMKKLSDFPALADFFFALPEYASKLLAWKNMPSPIVLENLRETRRILERVPAKKFVDAELQKTLAAFSETRGRGAVLWPLRVALSGKDVSPGPFEIMAVLGKKETIRRIDIAIQKIETMANELGF